MISAARSIFCKPTLVVFNDRPYQCREMIEKKYIYVYKISVDERVNYHLWNIFEHVELLWWWCPLSSDCRLLLEKKACRWMLQYFLHYSDVIMSTIASHITSVTIVYWTVFFFQAHIKVNIKSVRHWPWWGEFTDDQWIPLTKGQ